MVSSGNRRKHTRVPLKWPVRLIRQPGGPSVETTTENLSSEGLYCITSEPFKPGERLQCEILVPAESFGVFETPLRLQCRVIITRVESLRLIGAFGLGCQIEDYTLATGSPPSAI
jgi:PilZ domain